MKLEKVKELVVINSHKCLRMDFRSCWQHILSRHTPSKIPTGAKQRYPREQAGANKPSLWALSLCYFLQAKKSKKEHKGSSPCQKSGDHKASPSQNWLQQQKSTLLGQKSTLVSPGDALNPKNRGSPQYFDEVMLIFLPPPPEPTVSRSEAYRLNLCYEYWHFITFLSQPLKSNSTTSKHHTELPVWYTDKVYTGTNWDLITAVIYSESKERREDVVTVLALTRGNCTKKCFWNWQQCATKGGKKLFLNSCFR